MQEFLIGIDIGGTNTKILITDLHLNTFDSRVINTRLGISLDEYSEDVINAVEECFSSHGIDKKRVVSVGMGIPGLVDYFANKSIYLPLHDWDGIDPCEQIAAHFNAVSSVDNDANINALGEYYFGKGRDYRNMVYLTLGTGLGGAVIIDGKLLRGKRNACAEMGHICIQSKGGRRCVCGRNGCFQSYCSGTVMTELAGDACRRYPESMLAKYAKESGSAFNNALVSKAAQEGDTAALEVMDEIAFYLGVGVATIQKIFDPDAVFIGGGVSNAGELLLEPARKVAAQEVMHPVQGCGIFKATLGMNSGMYGAAVLAAMKIGIDVDTVTKQVHPI